MGIHRPAVPDARLARVVGEPNLPPRVWRGDRKRDAIDHFPGMAGDDGGAENSIAALSHMNLHKSVLFAISHGAVDVVHQDRECRDRNAALARLPNVKSDMRDLRIGIGAPGDRQCAQPLATEEQRIPDSDPAWRGGRSRRPNRAPEVDNAVLEQSASAK